MYKIGYNGIILQGEMMKNIIFFDIDNTLIDTNNKEIPSQTLKLLEELSKRDDYYLGIATGRGPGRLDVIKDIIHYFDAFICSNGSYVKFKDLVIHDHYFENDQIERIIKVAEKFDLLVGVSGMTEDAILRKPFEKIGHLKNTAQLIPKYYLENKVYQTWLASNNHLHLDQAVELLPDFDHYFWTNLGVDLTINDHSKGSGILQIKEILEPIRVICIGDGHNDIDMIEVADIGVAMGNTRFNALKEKADYIGPHVSDNLLYDFLKKNNII